MILSPLTPGDMNLEEAFLLIPTSILVLGFLAEGYFLPPPRQVEVSGSPLGSQEVEPLIDQSKEFIEVYSGV